jgi:hypothetical protein
VVAGGLDLHICKCVNGVQGVGYRCPCGILSSLAVGHATGAIHPPGACIANAQSERPICVEACLPNPVDIAGVSVPAVSFPSHAQPLVGCNLVVDIQSAQGGISCTDQHSPAKKPEA